MNMTISGLVHVPGSELEVAQGRVRRRRGGLPRVARVDAGGGLAAGGDARGGSRKVRSYFCNILCR